jgi:phospholipid/cholesterol/gamma-HCH transport system substrate-binding protein
MSFFNPETKVGLFTLLSMIILVALYLWLNGIQVFDRGHDVEVIFDRIEGLRPGAAVKFSGVDVGRISRIEFDETNKVIVVMRIIPSFKVPRRTKAIISSVGVIGDKYMELTPLAYGEPTPSGKRLRGERMISMDQIFNTAYSVMLSLKQITTDIQLVTGQFDRMDLAKLYGRLDRTLSSLERITQNGEPQINELLANLSQASLRIAQASVTASRLLSDIENNGQTATSIRQSLAHIERISIDLEKFSAILATKGPELDMLIKDAHTTMQAITQAAQSIDKAVKQISSGDGDSGLTIEQAGKAVKKVGALVSALEKISVTNSLGTGYRDDYGMTVDYRMNLNLNDRYALRFGVDNIGRESLLNLQWTMKYPSNDWRVGVYRGQFGLGLDYRIAKTTWSLDLWNTETPNLGFTAALNPSKNWSLQLNSMTEIETWDPTWSFEWWRHF